MRLLNLLNMARAPKLPASAPATTAPAPATTAAPGPAAVPRELRETSPPVPPAAPSRLFAELGFLPIPPALIAAVVRKAQTSLVTADELTTLRDLQRQFDEAHEFLQRHTDREAILAWKTQVSRAPDQPFAQLAASDSWSKADLQEDFAAKRMAAKARLRAVTLQARPIAQVVATRLSQVALIAFNEQEAKERLDSESFGLEYRPSLLAATLAQLSWRVTDQAAQTGGSYYPPAKMLLFAGIAL